jgi:catechol 2,3-dioxygenase-like lactoylglutathione lyase family enzyme
MDFRIELVPLAVSDVDRSVEFYGTKVGWNVDFDHSVTPELRFVQVTPPGSACSVCFGTGLGMMADGSTQFIQAVVDDADQALAYLKERGVECEGVDEQAWGRFVTFEDPDGNRWALQQIVRPESG